MKNFFKPIYWDNNLFLLDQRALPAKELFLKIESIEQCFSAIRDMVVRGAPAIGTSALYGLALWFRAQKKFDQAEFDKVTAWFRSCRPTAVNLMYEVDRVKALVQNNPGLTPLIYFEKVLELATDNLKSTLDQHTSMAKFAEIEMDQLFRGKPLNILTHCNTGHLACGELGTALGTIMYLHDRGKVRHVYADETRPYLQGSRLTAFELSKAEIPYSIVVEGAASYLMREGLVDAIMVGADRIASNGDTANKVGTSTLAIVASYYQIPFYVLAPSSSFDLNMKSGKEIHIELRDEEEILSWKEHRIAPLEARSLNPSFDVTDHTLIRKIFSEKGAMDPQVAQDILRVQGP